MSSDIVYAIHFYDIEKGGEGYSGILGDKVYKDQNQAVIAFLTNIYDGFHLALDSDEINIDIMNFFKQYAAHITSYVKEDDPEISNVLLSEDTYDYEKYDEYEDYVKEYIKNNSESGDIQKLVKKYLMTAIQEISVEVGIFEYYIQELKIV